jgi:ABC-2 type transport system ATP-binding protein
VISGTATATSGSVHFAREDGVGIVPESPALLSEMSAMGNLEMLASIRGKANRQDIRDALRLVGLDPENKKAVRYYSLGMKQRLMLAQAIMEQPRLLLLDEPTNGLDPLGIIDLRRLLSELAQRGAGIIIASHLLHEIARMCHRVVIIGGGRVIREVSSRAGVPQSVEIAVSGAADWLRLLDWAGERNVEELSPVNSHPRGLLIGQISVPKLVSELVSLGIAIEAIGAVPDNLEAAFLECSQLVEGVYR